jgi:hypothetical protein
MAEDRQRVAQRGDAARALGAVQPCRRRRVVHDRAGEPEPAQDAREPQIERAEVDQHDQVGRPPQQSQRDAQCGAGRARQAAQGFEDAHRGPAAVPLHDPNARTFEPRVADRLRIDGGARPHRAEQFGGQQLP